MSAEIALIFAIISFLADIAVVLGYLVQRSKAKERTAMEEGKHQEQVAEVQKDLARAYEKIRRLESCVQTSDVNMAEMKTDIKHILASLERLERKMDEGGK